MFNIRRKRNVPFCGWNRIFQGSSSWEAAGQELTASFVLRASMLVFKTGPAVGLVWKVLKKKLTQKWFESSMKRLQRCTEVGGLSPFTIRVLVGLQVVNPQIFLFFPSSSLMSFGWGCKLVCTADQTCSPWGISSFIFCVWVSARPPRDRGEQTLATQQSERRWWMVIWKECGEQPVLWGVTRGAIRLRWRRQLLTAGSLAAAAHTCRDFWWTFHLCTFYCAAQGRGRSSVQ